MIKACKIVFTIVYLLCNIAASAQTIYTRNDSIIIENILKNHTQSNGVIDIVSSFLGHPYVASTLDSCAAERLIINTRQFDCTTFIETITALEITAKGSERNFEQFCNNLTRLRYRNGELNGYASRLHYISQWICNSSKQGVIKEITTESHTATQLLYLNFMSKPPGSYLQLKSDSTLIAAIEEFEKPFREIEVKYIPKSALNSSRKTLSIEDGDILALVTAIKGLDVSHVGFAKWIDGKLHLVHASSSKGTIIIDEQTLFDYMKSKKNNLGIRVFRIQK